MQARISLQRYRLLLALMLTLILLTPFSFVLAQGNPAKPLNFDEPVQEQLAENEAARIFLFLGRASDTINLMATGDFPLVILLSDVNGTNLAEGLDDGGVTTISGVLLPQTGTYFATVVRAPGATLDAGSFELTLSTGELADISPSVVAAPVVPEATEAVTAEPTVEVAAETGTLQTTGAAAFIPPSEVLMANGMEVRLEWATAVDLNLEIRDPIGNTLYWDSRTNSGTGGTFGFDANGLCEVLTETPVETAAWRPGFLPTGSYEILIFYRQSCTTPAQPTPFTITVTVNGTQLEPIQGTLVPPIQGQSSVYVTNFLVATDASAAINVGGVYPDTSLRILPAQAPDIIANAQPITRDVVTTGAIFEAQDYLAYAFEAQANELITASLTATSGNLDTLLQVVDANGTLLDVNDDSGGTRNSTITNLRLANAGTYYIIATRYGKEIGGTEGEFELLLTGPTGELPPEVASLNLPQGAIEISLLWTTGADLQLLVRDPVGDSVFDNSPQVNSGGILAASGNVDCVRAPGTPVSYIYWPQGFLRPGTYEIEVWYQNQCDDLTPVEFTLTTLVNDTVVISERQFAQPNQRFVVSFTVGGDGTTARGDGGFINALDSTSLDYRSEAPVALSLSQPVTGTITQDNVFDLYAFDGTANQVISIAMTANSQTLDTRLFLISPSGVQVADNDDIQPGENQNSSISAFTLSETGQYLIIATRFALNYGGTVGSYSLVITGQ